MDALLHLMVLIWGANYSILKRAFEEIPPQAFNALRVGLASLVFLGVIRWTSWRGRRSHGLSRIFYTPEPLTRRDRWNLLWVGLVGHLLYQSTFIGGLGQTSASNAALIIGATPIVVAVLSAGLRLERITRVHWLGVGVSMVGIYFVVGTGAGREGASWRGDLLVTFAVVCWAVYTLGSARLMARHSPLFVTGMTMAIGGVPYAVVMAPRVASVDWTRVSAWAWGAVVFSALFALCLSYLIWYAAVQRIGQSRTAMYSNLVPIAAMAVAAVWLGESISAGRMLGAAAVLVGVFLTRLGRGAPAVPIEE